MASIIKSQEKLESALSEIAGDNTSGASQLFKKALRLFPQIARIVQNKETPTDEFLISLSERLLQIQPAMAPFAHLSRYFAHLAEGQYKKQVLYNAIMAFPHAVQRKLHKQQRAIIDHAAKELSGYSAVMTHSYSNLVHRWVEKWLKENEARSVWVTESRPMREGVNLIKQLAELPNRKVLLVDDARGLAMRQVQAVVIGADRISEKSITNKIGTYALVLLAREFQKPVYVLADGIKFLPESISLQSEPAHPAQEIAGELCGAEAFNFYFEQVPVAYVCGIITAEGMIRPEELEDKFKQGKWEIFQS